MKAFASRRLNAGLGAFAALVAAAALPAAAQDRPAQAPPAQQTPGTAPNPASKPHPRPHNRDRAQNLDFLFGALQAAPDEESAKIVESRIQALLLAQGGDTTELLMSRVRAAAESKDNALALKLLDAIVKLKPDYVEGWNRRATLHFGDKDFDAAILDLRQVLAREPRHFGALVGLGLIMQELGEDKRALELFRKAVAVYPRLPRIPDIIKDLAEKVEGRPI